MLSADSISILQKANDQEYIIATVLWVACLVAPGVSSSPEFSRLRVSLLTEAELCVVSDL